MSVESLAAGIATDCASLPASVRVRNLLCTLVVGRLLSDKSSITALNPTGCLTPCQVGPVKPVPARS